MTVISNGVAAWRGGSDIASSPTLHKPAFGCPILGATFGRS
jgi:hypothetical protein